MLLFSYPEQRGDEKHFIWQGSLRKMTILHTMKCEVQARDLNFAEVMQLACSLLEV